MKEENIKETTKKAAIETPMENIAETKKDVDVKEKQNDAEAKEKQIAAKNQTNAEPKDKEDMASAKEKLTISVPNNLDTAAFARLEALVSSKQKLLKKSLGTETLEIIKTEQELKFPWFTITGAAGEATAYTQLVAAMVKMAKEATRIDPKEKATANEKFTMRIFTVRLGLKGDEYKLIRKLLASNLSGNSAWKDGAPKKAHEDKQPEAEVPETDAKVGEKK